MRGVWNWSGGVVDAAAVTFVLFLAGCGGGDGSTAGLSMVSHWNAIAVDASGLDHTPASDAGSLVYLQSASVDISGPAYGEQLGPIRASRAMAIVQIAVFEAVNAIQGEYRSYLSLPRAPVGTSVDAAVAAAAHDALAALFPAQTSIFDDYLAEDLAALRDAESVEVGLAVGGEAAATILSLRAGDGSDHIEARVGVDYIPADGPGEWRQDPISQHPLALGSNWSVVEPFVMDSAEQFRTPPPPALGSIEYADAFDEVGRLGGDGIITPTERTEEQTQIGLYWAYDGTPSLCAPPRLYNQIARQIADEQGSDPAETARLLALVNVAMADAGIAAWESKYHYRLWRPVTGIREADAGSGPTEQGDGNSETFGDPNFTPLGAPASNLAGPNFTPPFPAYPSGHAVFGGALFEVLRRFYGTDDIAFTFVSDELNGITRDNQGEVRPLRPRSFSSLSEAEEENGQSRIYLGIHWGFDKTEGIAQGRRVADHVIENLYRRLP